MKFGPAKLNLSKQHDVIKGLTNDKLWVYYHFLSFLGFSIQKRQDFGEIHCKLLNSVFSSPFPAHFQNMRNICSKLKNKGTRAKP